MPLAEVYENIVGPDAPVAFQAYDGSGSGSVDAVATIDVRSPAAFRYMITAPGELGVARAYISGALDIHGDLYEALAQLQSFSGVQVTWRDRLDLLRAIGPRVIGPVRIPREEIRMTRRLGSRHSRARDAAAIAHHYDVSNAFYRIVLGPSMAYTCAVFPDEDASLDEAQEEKFDLVCRKLHLSEGDTLLDVGCGWGGMVLHATRNYGVKALGVTLSKQQADWGAKAIAEQGLGAVAEIRHADYRDVTASSDGPFDAISSIGLTEHIGLDQLPSYFSHLYGLLRPQGRLLNHSITRPMLREAKMDPNGFINRYVFPDGELEEVGTIISAMNEAGFECQHMDDFRTHYTKTLHGWCANLRAGWDDAVKEVGQGRARVWALYMAASELLFKTNRMQLHQVLATRTEDGLSGLPLRLDLSRR